MVTTAVAVAVKVPGVSLLIVNVQVATLPLIAGVAQVLVLEVSPAVGVTFGVMEVKTVGEAPSGRAFTVMVKTCAVPTSFTASGAIWMLASTYFFTASPLEPWVPSVARLMVAPAIVRLAVA